MYIDIDVVVHISPPEPMFNCDYRILDKKTSTTPSQVPQTTEEAGAGVLGSVSVSLRNPRRPDVPTTPSTTDRQTIRQPQHEYRPR